MSNGTTTPGTDDRDSVISGMLRFYGELFNQNGPGAAQTFVDLVEACSPHAAAPLADWESEMRAGVDALERGAWREVRDRLDRIAAARDAECPHWCEGSHAAAGPDDGIHSRASEMLVEGDIATDTGTAPAEVLVSLQQRPGQAPRVVLVINDRPDALELPLAAAEHLITDIREMVATADR